MDKHYLNDLISELKLNPKQFAESIGLLRPDKVYHVLKGRNGMSSDLASKICARYPSVNYEWLLSGDGEMLKPDAKPAKIATNNSEVIYVPLLPIQAQGGSLNDFVVSVKDSDCEMIVSPIKGADFAINVSGDSMHPEYPSGSQILIKRINERAFIDWGKTYVLDTCNGTIIKRIFPSDSKDSNIVKCVSINPDYPPFEVNLSEDVYGVYRVMMIMAVK